MGDGATTAPTLAELVRQADVLLLVLPDYETTREVLPSEDVACALEGKAIVQLCSGTPEEARKFAKAIASLGARCLLDTAEARGILTRFPQMIVDVFEKAVAEGHGDEEICGAVKAFESSGRE